MLLLTQLCLYYRYANRAKNIKNKPKINEDPKDALLREFQEEIARFVTNDITKISQVEFINIQFGDCLGVRFCH